MSSRSKGRYTINLCKEYYEEKGYIIDECELPGRFRTSKDLYSGYCFDCKKICGIKDHDNLFPGFDLAALKPCSPMLLIQVKTNTPATQAPYKEFAETFASSHVHIIVWTHYRRAGPRIQRYCKNGSIVEKDLR